ncbi:helix-turn-helix transcriptional regulator [Humibacter albus]|uniref:helix-turn-helix transcriptional regulator n=1 Tax=Humibacter albus TaxID=427754 RepID=UPI0003B30977|nr:transcriptional regulator [Humibacter albus]
MDDTTAALEPSARRRVLDVLAAAQHPLDAHAVADALGVHVTTARFHLDQLGVAGLVQRRAMQEKRRGRPRMVYSPAGEVRAAGAREQLLEALVQVVGGEDTGERASVNAGRRWAEAMPEPVVPASDDESAVNDLVDVLDTLGFEPEHVGDDILMHGCPFRDIARARPDVVCSVHRGLIEGLLQRAGTDEPARLVPFVEPELCKVSLGGTLTR